MTKAEWKFVATRWFWEDHFEFVCDGYALTLGKFISERGQIGYVVYVNGMLKGSYVTQACEERRRFYRPSSMPRYGAKTRRALGKLLNKKERAERIPIWSSYWTNVVAFRRHLTAQNQQIDLISPRPKAEQSRDA